MGRRFTEIYYEVKDLIDLFPSEYWDSERMTKELIARGVRKNLTKVKLVEKALWRLATEQYVAVRQLVEKPTAFVRVITKPELKDEDS